MSDTKHSAGDTKGCQVVNVQHKDCDLYIGRGDGGDAHMLNTAPGEPGWLGNPYALDDNTRVEAVGRFEKAFIAKLTHDPAFREAVDGIEANRLGCYCAPKLCHGLVIARYLTAGIDRLALAP